LQGNELTLAGTVVVEDKIETPLIPNLTLDLREIFES